MLTKGMLQLRHSFFEETNTTEYAYDSYDRLVQIRNNKGENFALDYDGLNRFNRITRPGSSTLITYDTTSFLSSIVHSKGASTLSYFEYDKDSIGNKTAARTSAGHHSYSYDSNSQLTGATHPESDGESFNYDQIGNRSEDTGGTYEYDPKKQKLDEDYRFIYTYDNNGNLSTKQSKTDNTVHQFIHNSENQLVGYKLYDGTTLLKEAAYLYDALGRRVLKEVVDYQNSALSFSRKYAYDGNELLFEYDADNTLLTSYTHSTLRTDDVLSVSVTSAGKEAGIAPNATSYMYLKDGLGTISEVTDTSGNIVQRYVYSSFGQILKYKNGAGQDIAPVIKTPFTFTGREFDEESGLYYYRARYYEPVLGRFLEQDPDSGNSLDPLSVVNKYSYVSNSPLNFTDPSGQIKFKTLVAGAILGPANGLMYVGSRMLFLDNKVGSRLDNVIITGAVLSAAFYVAPVTAGVAVGTTAFQNRNKQGNFFDNLDDFTIDFAVNFAVSYAMSGGNDIDPKGNASLPFIGMIPVNALGFSGGVGLGGVIAKEAACRNSDLLFPKGTIQRGVGRTLQTFGMVSDRGKEGACF